MDQENALNPRKHAQHNSNGHDPALEVPSVQGSSSSLKRKRDDKSTLEEHLKLQEFLEVMQPVSKSRTWSSQYEDIKGDKAGQQDIIVNDEVDGEGGAPSPNNAEYQEVPPKQKKPRKSINEISQSPEKKLPFNAVSGDTESGPATEIGPPAGEPEASTITDDDWLRSRTSRLLGLVDDGPALQDAHNPERGSMGEASCSARRQSSSETSDAGVQVDAGLVQQADTEARLVDQETDGTATATGRLFVRNLPYTVTDQELRHHFEQLGCGHLEEVITMLSYLLYKLAFLHMVYDEHPDRDNLCIHASDVTQEQYFSRCSFFPETIYPRITSSTQQMRA